MNDNNLVGRLSTSFSGYEVLETVLLSDNELSGGMPRGLDGVPNLRVLDVSSNFLEGSVPEDLCSPDGSSKLTDLLIARNRLSGSLQLSNCKSLVSIIATDNFLTGAIPSPKDLPNLRTLSLEQNAFSQNTVESTDTISPLTSLSLANNRLSGVLFDGGNVLEGLRLLRVFNVKDNNLSDELPELIFTELTSLSTFNGARNNFRGLLPPIRIGSMVRLALDQNLFEGTIPESYKLLAKNGTLVNLQGTLLSCCGTEPDLQAALELSTAEGRGVRPDDLYKSVNYSAPRLPSFLEFSSFKLPVAEPGTDPTGLRCPVLKIKSQLDDPRTFVSWTLDPAYYMFESCDCGSGSELKNMTREGRPFYFECVPIPEDDHHPFAEEHPWAIVIIIIVGLIAILLVVFGLLGRSKMEWQLKRWKKRMLGAPASGQPASIVTTDVAGYTALCAKDPNLARMAMDMHNKFIEQARWASCGSVIDMGGDSYTLAFRDAFDAVAFSIQTQLLMESAVWPTTARVSRSGSIVPLLGTASSAVSPTPADASPSPTPRAGFDQADTPRGTPRASSSLLRESTDGTEKEVETPVHSQQPSSTDLGTQLRVRIGIATGTLAANMPLQTSPVVVLSKEISDAAAGGQTLMDGATFQLVKDQLLELGSVTEDGLELEEGWSKKAWKSFSSSLKAFRSKGPAYRPNKGAAVVLNMGHFVRASAVAGKEERPATCSQQLALVPMYTQSSDISMKEGQPPEAAGKEKPRSLLIFQVLAPRMVPQAGLWGGSLGLNADWVPSISSQAFFSAPGALQSLLGPPELLPCITAVFVSASGFQSFEEKYPEEAAQVADQVALCLQRMLREVEGGYLCRSFQGCKFMLTFQTPEAAIKWCLGVQQAVIEQHWPGLMFNPPGFTDVCVHGRLAFRGPRLKMSLQEGKPDSIQADYMGRADYLGDVMNTASRFLEAASGGMVVCDEQLARRTFDRWNKEAQALNEMPPLHARKSSSLFWASRPDGSLRGTAAPTMSSKASLTRYPEERGLGPNMSSRASLTSHPEERGTPPYRVSSRASLTSYPEEEQPTADMLAGAQTSDAGFQAHSRSVLYERAGTGGPLFEGPGMMGEQRTSDVGVELQPSSGQLNTQASSAATSSSQHPTPFANNLRLSVKASSSSILDRAATQKPQTVHAYSLGVYMFKGGNAPRSMVGLLQEDLEQRIAALLPLKPPKQGSKAERVAEPSRLGSWIASAYGVRLPTLEGMSQGSTNQLQIYPWVKGKQSLSLIPQGREDQA